MRNAGHIANLNRDYSPTSTFTPEQSAGAGSNNLSGGDNTNQTTKDQTIDGHGYETNDECKEDFKLSNIKAKQLNNNTSVHHYNSQVDLVTLNYRQVARLENESQRLRQEVAEMKRERKIFFQVLKKMGLIDRVLKAVALKMYEKRIHYKFKEENEIELLERG